MIRLEINEFARRPKREEIPRPAISNSAIAFPEIEDAVRAGDRERAADLMAAFREQQGSAELARKLLLLGSGYLEGTLGHSVSCTAFILLEMMERSDQDPWPALATLSDYFCKGRFHATPRLRTCGSTFAGIHPGEFDAGGQRRRDCQPAPHDYAVFGGKGPPSVFRAGIFAPGCLLGRVPGSKKRGKHPEMDLTPRARFRLSGFLQSLSPGGKKKASWLTCRE